MLFRSPCGLRAMRASLRASNGASSLVEAAVVALLVMTPPDIGVLVDGRLVRFAAQKVAVLFSASAAP